PSRVRPASVRTAGAGPSAPALHGALPISSWRRDAGSFGTLLFAAALAILALGASRELLRMHRETVLVFAGGVEQLARGPEREDRDRKSTRLNSSHVSISYAVFCLHKQKSG